MSKLKIQFSKVAVAQKIPGRAPLVGELMVPGLISHHGFLHQEGQRTEDTDGSASSMKHLCKSD